MKSLWNYAKIGLKGVLNSVLTSIVLVPLELIIYYIGFILLANHPQIGFVFMIILLLLLLPIYLVVYGYFGKKFWGWD